MAPRFKTAQVGDLVQHLIPEHRNYWVPYELIPMFLELWIIEKIDVLAGKGYGKEYVFSLKLLYRNRKHNDNLATTTSITDVTLSTMNIDNQKENWIIL
jgi:hypothetical protein